MRNEPRVVLVTGASSGIGRAVALACAAEGDDVVLVARDEPVLHQVAQACEKAGAASTLVTSADVGDDAAVARCVGLAMERHGQIDAVVHCAAVLAYGRTEQIPAGIFDAVLRTNLIGSVNVVRHAVAQMRRQQHGTLVLVGSIAGHVASPQMSPYVLSKWGIRILARQLAIENRDMDDVRIVYVAPGGVDTPIYAQAANYHGHAGRPPPPIASPEKVARAIVRRLDGQGRRRAHTAWTNHPIRVGFTALPRLFDAMANPFFRLVVSDRTQQVEATTGNVLHPVGSHERTHGDQRGPWAAIARNVVATAAQRRRGARGR